MTEKEKKESPKSKFIIGDVHGCFDTLQALIKKLPKDADLVFVGDLIDRGTKSKEVVEFVKSNGYDCVMGNHEKMAIDEAVPIIQRMERQGFTPKSTLWTMNGGYAALESYVTVSWKNLDDETTPGVRPERLFDQETFEEHIDWMLKLPIYLEYPEFEKPLVISHSVIHNHWKNRDNPSRFAEQEVLWGRSFHNLKDAGIFNVIGHTPQENGPTIKKIYANVDTGCFYKKEGFGKLTALQYPEMKVFEQECIDEVSW